MRLTPFECKRLLLFKCQPPSGRHKKQTGEKKSGKIGGYQLVLLHN